MKDFMKKGGQVIPISDTERILIQFLHACGDIPIRFSKERWVLRGKAWELQDATVINLEAMEDDIKAGRKANDYHLSLG